MVALVEAQLQIDRLAVEGHVRIIRAGKLFHPDLALPEVGVDFVVLPEAGLHLIQERVVEVPEVLVLDRDGECGLVFPADPCGEGILPAGLELQLEGFSFRCRGVECDIHLDG